MMIIRNYFPQVIKNKNVTFKSYHSNVFDRNCTHCSYIYQAAQPVKADFYPDEYIEKIGDKTYLKDCYYIIYLISCGMGEGKNEIKKVLRESLANPKTNGRIILFAENIDGKASPAGFYYKMGFRFRDNNNYNNMMANWLKTSGLKSTAPNITGGMYLPRENIHKCLNY